MHKKFMSLRFALALFLLQFTAHSGAWAADAVSPPAPPPVTWQYSFTLPRDQAIKQDKNIKTAAANSKARVTYAFEEKGGASVARVVLDGSSTSVAQLNHIISGANAGLKSLIDQPSKVSIKGYLAQQSPVRIVLRSNLTTGHLWNLDAASLAVVEGEATETYEQASPLLGAPGRQIFVLNARISGNVAILFNYGRHGEATRETTSEDSATLDVQVNGSLPQTLDLSTAEAIPATLPPIVQAVEAEALQDEVSSTPLLGLPTSYDLRPSMTGVKDQGQCGSCWAFATVGVLEGLIKKNTGATIDLSEQFLVSCNRSNWSCNGGWWAHDYHKASGTLGNLQSVAGAVIEADMPYRSSNASCSPIPNHPYSVASWSYVGPQNGVASTDAIKNTIFTYGAVSAAICVGPAFSRYAGGVFSTNEASLCATGVNHAVVLVGWDDNTQSWLLRNSWGTGWGESGYMRIAYGISNIGFGATYANYGANTCSYSLGATSASVSAAGGSGNIAITSQGGCSWTASSNASWITVLSGSGSGNGNVAYSVAPNNGSLRTGTITAAGKTFTVTQQATASCTYAASPTSISAAASGLTGSINVTTQGGCAWSTSNPLNWASIVSGSSGTGSGAVGYSVSPNTGSARTGTLTIAGQTVSIGQQAATQCTYSLNTLSNNFSSTGGSGTVGVLTQGSCAWTAASGASWLTIVSGVSGAGSGIVTYSASANSSTSNRSGTLTIGGQTFTVNQSGASQGGDGQLTNSVALTSETLVSSGPQSAWKYYSFTVPVGAANLVLDLFRLTGDLDLFVRQGDKPTSDIYSCVSYRPATSNDQCVITAPTPGTWWIGVNNYDTGTIGYSVRASWGAADTQLASGVPASGSVSNSPTMIWRYFYIDVPSGATRLVTDLYNLTGDADVYLKFGAKPDVYSVDECDSMNFGTTPEQCDIVSPAGGRWWIAVVNYDASASYSVKATLTSSAQTLPSAPTGVVATPGNSSVSVAFTPGAIGSGSLVNYWAGCNAGAGTIFGSGSASPVTVGGLANGSSYVCYALTRSTVGDGSWSSASNTVIPGTPSQPTNLAATVSPGRIQLSFTAPASAGGSAISSYTASCSAVGQPTRTATGGASPISVTGLTDGVSYSCSVTANNVYGTGSVSTSVTATARQMELNPILMLLLE